jgi:redox-sensitive bicupin YhaK (pirin superfamily)
MLPRVIFLQHHSDKIIARVAYKNECRSIIQTFNYRFMSSKIQITPRPSNERGNADHGWLKSFHTWSFASYHDPRFVNGFGCLRVLNEDRVQPTTGFGSHPHREYEIFSYIIDGELQHKDSMGNTEILHRGEVQFTSAGTGIEHSEYNVNKSLWVHFIQIWVKPNQSKLKPSYTTKKWSDEEKLNKLCLLIDDIKNSNDKTIAIHAPISMFASILQPNKSIKHIFKRTKGYIHLIMRSGYEATNGAKIRLGEDVILQEGDGAFINSDKANDEVVIENIGSINAEFLLFDLE